MHLSTNIAAVTLTVMLVGCADPNPKPSGLTPVPPGQTTFVSPPAQPPVSTANSGPALSDQPESDVRVVSAKIVPWTMATNGELGQMVMVNWKNVSKRQVYRVNVDIDAFDEMGSRLESSTPDYAIYWRKAGIKAGQTYKTAAGEGYVLAPSYGKAKKVDLRVTKVGFEAPAD